MRIDPRALHYEESNDPAKMAYSRMALIRRGPSAKPASSRSRAGAGKLQLSKRVTCSLEQSLSRASGAPRNANKAPGLAIRSANGASDDQSGGWQRCAVRADACAAL